MSCAGTRFTVNVVALLSSSTVGIFSQIIGMALNLSMSSGGINQSNTDDDATVAHLVPCVLVVDTRALIVSGKLGGSKRRPHAAVKLAAVCRTCQSPVRTSKPKRVW